MVSFVIISLTNFFSTGSYYKNPSSLKYSSTGVSTE